MCWREFPNLSELTEGQIDREEMFWFDGAHVNARPSPPHRTCATGSYRLPPSLVAPLIATWTWFLFFLETT
jgi:hypothetical protein